MADNKKRFAPEEIAESLRCHIDQESCIGCPLFEELNCTETMHDTAADMLEELLAENKRLREENRWIPTSERLPELNSEDFIHETVPVVEVLVMIEGATKSATLCFDGDVFFDLKEDGEFIPYRVTHWKPMPKGSEVGHE